MNHRMLTVGAALLCLLVFAAPLKAEKKNILVAEWNNIRVDARNGFQVNPKGDIVEYQFSVDLGGLLTVVDYTITRKSGSVKLGKIPAEFFPAEASGIEFVALERHTALVLFTTLTGGRVYMTFNLVANDAVPRPSKTNPEQHVAQEGELCSMSGSRIISHRYTDDTYTRLIAIRTYNHSWRVQANHGIDDRYGDLAPLNPPVQRYYVGISPTGDPERVNVRVLKP